MRVQDLSDEELAAILEVILMVGICPTNFERECLQEAADRLRRDLDDGK